MSDSDDQPETPATAGAAARDKPMGFWDHLDALRSTLIKCVVVFLIFACLIGFFLKQSSEVLNWPMNHVRTEFPNLKTLLITTTPLGVFSVLVQICVLGGLVLSLPFILYFVGQFVAPALTEKELKVIVPVGAGAITLFLLGAAFSYFLLVPSTVRVAMEFNQRLGYEVYWTADKYYSMLVWMVLGVGATFECPLVILLLCYLGIVRVETFRKYRRHTIVGIFVLAAVVTPTPDPFTQALFALPIYLLFELGVFLGGRIKRRSSGDDVIEV